MKKRLQGQVLTHSLSDAAHTVRYNGLLHCFRTIQATEGLQGFYRVSRVGVCCTVLLLYTVLTLQRFYLSWLVFQGIGATVAKSVVSTAITFAAYEVRTIFGSWLIRR